MKISKNSQTADWMGEFAEKSMENSLVKTSQDLKMIKDIGPLNERELSRAIRDAIVGELNAIRQYETIVDAAEDKRVKEVIQDIANEEKVHVGELQELLRGLGIDEQDFLDEGAKEVNDK